MCAASRDVEESLAGSRVLSLFVNPLNAEVLRAHADGPQRVSKLHRRVEWAAQTTLRASVATLAEAGALANVRGTSYSVEHDLTPAGVDMLEVSVTLDRWLAHAPEGPIAPNSKDARSAVKALAEGWNSTVVRALAGQPHSVTELAERIPEADFPMLERRLGRMRTSGQVQRERGEGRTTPFEVTDWLRQSIAPLSVAGRCERRHMPGETAPITAIETEAAFLLTLPLVILPETASGACVLAVRTGGGEAAERPVDSLSGVTVTVERGRVTGCGVEVAERPPSWALGTSEAWLDAVIDGDLTALRFNGTQPRLARALVHGLHHALFGRRGRRA